MQGMAKQWYSYRLKPYVGSWDQNFPGVIYIHYVVIALLGKSELAFRTVDTLVHIGIAVEFYLLLRRWLDHGVALGASLLGVAVYHAGGIYLAGQRDGFATAALLWCMLIYFDHLIDPNRRSYLLHGSWCGILTAFALTLRPTFVLFAIAFSVLLALYNPQGKKVASVYAASVIVGVVMWLSPFFLDPKAFHEFILATVQFNIDIYSTSFYRASVWKALKQPPEIIANLSLLVLLTTIFIKQSSTREKIIDQSIQRSPSRTEWIALLALYISLRLPIWIMGKFFVYHYEPISLFVIAGIALLFRYLSQLLPKWSSLAYMVLVCTVVMLSLPWHAITTYATSVTQQHSAPLQEAYQTFGPDGFGEKEQSELASYLNTSPAIGGIINLSIQGDAAWRVERPLTSRFQTFFSIGMQTPDKRFTPYQLQWQEEVAKEIEEQRAAFVILGIAPRYAPFLNDAPGALLSRIPTIQLALAENYEHDTMIAIWEVLRPKHRT